MSIYTPWASERDWSVGGFDKVNDRLSVTWRESALQDVKREKGLSRTSSLRKNPRTQEAVLVGSLSTLFSGQFGRAWDRDPAIV